MEAAPTSEVTGPARSWPPSRPLASRENHLFVGLLASQGRVTFRAQSTVATLTDGRQALDTGLLDPLSSVAVDSVVDELGVYATDTLALRQNLFVTASARFNASWLSLEDRIGRRAREASTPSIG